MMRVRLIEFLVALAIVIGIGVLAAVVMPGSGHIERSLVIGKDMRQVYDVLDNFRRLAVDDTNCGEMLTYRTIRLVALLVLDGVAITIECRNRRTYNEKHFRLRNEETITQLILDAERCELLIGHDAIEVLLLNFKNRYFCHFIT